MAKALLVGPALEEGLRFIELLKKEGIAVSAAVWHRPPINTWRLSIVSPTYETGGLERLYSTTRAVFNKAVPELEMNEDDIYFPRPKTNFAKDLRRHHSGSKNVSTTLYDMEGDAHEAFVYFAK